MHQKQPISAGIVVVAAGRGERAGASAEGPKQYRSIGGRPVIAHTLDVFRRWPSTTHIVVVIHPDDEILFANSLDFVKDGSAISTVHGGATRHEQ